jgi:hypothetical protein
MPSTMELTRIATRIVAVIDSSSAAATAEYQARDQAVNEYASEAFDEAKKEDFEVVLIVIRANIVGGPCGTNGDKLNKKTRWGIPSSTQKASAG